MPSSHVVLDQVDITFDDQGSAASAGLLLPATLAERLGIEQVTDQVVDLGDRLGAAHPGRKLLTLVHAMSPASAHTRRAAAAVFCLAKDPSARVTLPWSCSWARRR
jgi:antitoxin component of MazEF toxin-antitoxin module